MPRASMSVLPAMTTASKIGFALTGIVLLMYLLHVQLLDVVELKTYDMRLRSGATRVPAGQVTIAAIDEKSIAKLGRWPWPRTTFATLIERLDDLGARVIAMDVFFPESENQKLIERIERLEAEKGFATANSPYASLKEQLAVDALLGRAIATSGRVVLAMAFLMSPDEASALPKTETERAFEDLKRNAVAVSGDGSTGPPDLPMDEPAGLLAKPDSAGTSPVCPI
jgi:CHASE2 domain-containing sensor protein